MNTTRTWVVVTSREHARRAVADGQVRANSGKRRPLQQLAVGDRIVIYSPRTDYPDGEPLRAVTAMGAVTGEQPVATDANAQDFHRAASLTEIQPVPLSRVREHLIVPLLRFGFFAVKDESANALWELLTAPPADGPVRGG